MGKSQKVNEYVLADMCVSVFGCVVKHFLKSVSGASGKEPACLCRRHKRLLLDVRVRKIPWGRAWQPTPVFLPGEFPWTEDPGRLQSIGLQRVRHN